MTSRTVELFPQHDSRKSFYKKATVVITDTEMTLISYTTAVAVIKDNKALVYGTYSPTTLRHIKEFLKQNGFKAESKKQIEADYLEVE